MKAVLECLLVEPIKDEWYYIIENAPPNISAWNWIDYSTAYGPFPNIDTARIHLKTNHSNFDNNSVMEFNHFSKLSEHKKEPYLDLMRHSILKLIQSPIK